MSALLDVPLGPDYEWTAPTHPPSRNSALSPSPSSARLSATFWMAFHQNGSTLTLWARDNTIREYTFAWAHRFDFDGSLPGRELCLHHPLTPVVVWVMGFLRERRLEPSTPAKIGIGMLLTAAAYHHGACLDGGRQHRARQHVVADWLLLRHHHR